MSTSATASVINAPASRADFPTWLPPMLVKELRQGLRTRGFVGSLVGFQAAMVIAFVWAFAVNIFGHSNAQETVNGFFWTVLGIMLLLVTPLRAMAGLRQEIDARTLDLLMLTHLNGWRIVLGKWVSLLVQTALLVLALLPYGIVRYFFGSVDLVQDLIVVGSMYLGCGVLTAVALWVSGLPRLLRIGLPVGLVLMSQGLAGAIFGVSRHGHGSFFPMGTAFWAAMAVMVFNCVLLLLFCLVQAVRRIAPPAEDYSPFARGLALLTLAPVPLLYAFGEKDGAVVQLWFAIVALALVTIIEISSLRRPMAVHVRRWWGRGRLGAGIGRLVLPGWPSAAAFAAFWLALASLGAGIGLLKLPGATSGEIIWLFTLLWAALVFPMVVLSFAPNLGRQTPLVYFILHAAFGILALIIGNASNVRMSPVAAMFEWLAHLLPVTSFWLQLEPLGSLPAYDGRYFTGQAVMVTLVVVMAVWRMAAYWRWVRTHGAVARAEKAAPVE
jgi:hypothetical protein